MRTHVRWTLAVTAVSALVLTGCGDTEETTGSPSGSDPTDDGSAARDAIEVEIEGDRIQPSGKRVEVAAGQEVRLEVESDRPGEFHVHSSPEQTPSFEPGQSVVSLTIERPGIVDVEEHESGIVVLQLEVR